MKLYSYIISLAITVIFATSCKKTNLPDKPIDTIPSGDARSVLIKDITAEKLPPPYFSFRL